MRDKKAAAKRKGKWTGGYLPLGYDLDAQGGKLVVNPAEANQVRAIFELFAESRSLTATLEELHRRGWQTKSWVTEKQVRHAGARFTEDSLGRLLANELYAGAVHYKEKSYRGEQPRIVAARLWRRVQRQLPRAQTARIRKERNKHGAMLQGILYCGACGRRMSHTFTCRGERRYRYYLCRGSTCGGQSITAAAFEASVIEQLQKVMRRNQGAKLREFLKTLTLQPQPAPEMLTRLRALVDRVTYHQHSGEVLLRLRGRKEKPNA
jgi:site-specific DNA recombinase